MTAKPFVFLSPALYDTLQDYFVCSDKTLYGLGFCPLSANSFLPASRSLKEDILGRYTAHFGGPMGAAAQASYLIIAEDDNVVVPSLTNAPGKLLFTVERGLPALDLLRRIDAHRTAVEHFDKRIPLFTKNHRLLDLVESATGRLNALIDHRLNNSPENISLRAFSHNISSDSVALDTVAIYALCQPEKLEPMKQSLITYSVAKYEFGESGAEGCPVTLYFNLYEAAVKAVLETESSMIDLLPTDRMQ